MDSQTPND
ncbi:hypothetical protein Tsp_10451, partial [Trichinella spiralis]